MLTNLSLFAWREFCSQYFFRSFDFIILRWRIRSESFRDDSSQFHKFSILESQSALVVHSYKSNDLIVSDSNRLQKFTNYRKNVIFSRMSINEIHSSIKIDEVIDSKIFVILFIHWNQIVIDSIQRIINRFFLLESSRHYLVCLDQSTRLASINRQCWIEIVNFDLIYLFNKMSNNFWSRVIQHFMSFSTRDHQIKFKCFWFNFKCFKLLIWKIIFENSMIFYRFNDAKDSFFSMQSFFSMFQWIFFFIILIRQIKLMKNSNINATFNSWILIESSNFLTTIFIVS